MKLWQKNTTLSEAVEVFTVGKDKEFDLLLAPYDVLGNIAHAKMLATVGLLTEEEASALVKELQCLSTFYVPWGQWSPPLLLRFPIVDN